MATSPLIIQAPKNDKGILDKVIGAGLVVGGLWYARKVYRDYVASKQMDAAGGDPNIQAAIEIHQAIDGAGTSEKVLYNIATRIKDWKEVSKAYRKTYPGKDMLTDIKGDLDPPDFVKFMNIYNLSQTDEKGQPVTSKNTVQKGLWVFVEKDVNVRKTARVVSFLEEQKNALKNPLNPLAPKNNIIFLAKPGKYLGVATGRQSVDTSTAESTLFIEIMIGALDSKGAHSLVNVWVASSQVKTESKPGFKPTAAQLYVIAIGAYTNALSGIGTDTNYKSELVLNKPSAAILDLNGNLMSMAIGNDLILGFKDSEYSIDDKRYFVFVTVQGLKRMIEVTNVKENKIAA